MTIPLTPEVLYHAYEFLCSTEPYVRWNLPSADDITFIAIASKKKDSGLYIYDREKDTHTIVVNSAHNGHTNSILMTLGHEIIHLHQRESGMFHGAEHNKAFHKLAVEVCKYHGWDPQVF